MKLYLKIPGGGEVRYKRQPMSKDRFRAVCRLLAFAVWAVLARELAAECGIFGPLWLFGFTLAAMALRAWILTEGGNTQNGERGKNR